MKLTIIGTNRLKNAAGVSRPGIADIPESFCARECCAGRIKGKKCLVTGEYCKNPEQIKRFENKRQNKEGIS